MLQRMGLITLFIAAFALLPHAAFAQVSPQNANVVVVDKDSTTTLTAPSAPTSTNRDEGAGDSLTLGISLDAAVTAPVTITVSEAASSPTFRNSDGDILVGSQCSVETATQGIATSAVSFDLNDTTEVEVIVRPKDDPVVEVGSAHYCDILITRQNNGGAASDVLTYRVNLDDSADDPNTVGTIPDMRGTPPMVLANQNEGVLYVFTRPKPTSDTITFTYTSQTPGVCNTSLTNFSISPPWGENAFFTIPVTLEDVSVASTCTLVAEWSPVPAGYPTNYDIPDINLMVVPVEQRSDVNGDGFITPADAVAVVNRQGEDANLEADADVDLDGDIDPTDADIVLQRIGITLPE